MAEQFEIMIMTQSRNPIDPTKQSKESTINVYQNVESEASSLS
jgi:hypothetical protein